MAFALELTSDGGDCMRLSVHKDKDEKARVFPGFKKEVARGGIMNILVNKRQAVEAAWEQYEENKKRQEAMGIPAIG
jgi:hypothetical protein